MFRSTAKLGALLGALICFTTADAGEATLSWAPVDLPVEVAIGSCNGNGGYGLDVSDFTGSGYIRVAPATPGVLILRLEQGETFCFRARPIALSGVPGPWLFLGSKKIPLDEPHQPPTLPQPPSLTNGSVL